MPRPLLDSSTIVIDDLFFVVTHDHQDRIALTIIVIDDDGPPENQRANRVILQANGSMEEFESLANRFKAVAEFVRQTAPDEYENDDDV